jgi:hypothetical protein
MSGPYDRPRVTVNWARVRPSSWRGWLTAVGFVAVAFAVLSLIAVIASTVFVIALVVALIAAVAFFIGNIFRGGRPKRDVGPYRGNYDA